jgi:hypothetical protein
MVLKQTYLSNLTVRKLTKYTSIRAGKVIFQGSIVSAIIGFNLKYTHTKKMNILLMRKLHCKTIVIEFEKLSRLYIP